MKENYDVIVVGAGPAGSFSAFILARAGCKVLLIEKHVLPRHKHCAGAITSSAHELLLREGIDCTPTYQQQYSAVRLSFKELEVKVHIGRNMIAGTYRETFDHLIVKRAMQEGVTLINDVVTDLRVNADSVSVLTRSGRLFKAFVVLGADGVHSVIRHAIGIGYERKKLAFGVEGEIPVDSAMLDRLYPDCFHVDYGYVPSGYVWAFPKRKGKTINVGVGYLLDEHRGMPVSPLQVLNSFLTDKDITNGIESIPFHSALLPFGGTCNLLGADRVLLLGDAAGFVDPLSGEGITYALESALQASRVTSHFLKEGGDLVQEYTKAVNPISTSINEYGLAIQRSMFGNRRRMVELCATEPSISRMFRNLFTKKMTYKEALEQMSLRRVIIPFIRVWFLNRTGRLAQYTEVL